VKFLLLRVSVEVSRELLRASTSSMIYGVKWRISGTRKAVMRTLLVPPAFLLEEAVIQPRGTLAAVVLAELQEELGKVRRV